VVNPFALYMTFMDYFYMITAWTELGGGFLSRLLEQVLERCFLYTLGLAKNFGVCLEKQWFCFRFLDQIDPHAIIRLFQYCISCLN
jgi:hypothetical protein